MMKVQVIPGTCGSRSAPPEVSEPGGVASLNTYADAKSNKGFTDELQNTPDHRVDGISGATPGVSPSASSRGETGMAEKESCGEVVGGQDSLRTCDRILEEALGDGGNDAKNGV